MYNEGITCKDSDKAAHKSNISDETYKNVNDFMRSHFLRMQGKQNKNSFSHTLISSPSVTNKSSANTVAVFYNSKGLLFM